jgi:chromosome segregation ATPase
MMKRLGAILAVAVLGFAVVGAGAYAQEISDWWFLRSYQPPRAIADLADETSMSQEGRKYFYVSDPKINDKQTFNRNCPTREAASVLGCYRNQRIYLLRVERRKLDGVMEVTAAHEMLHAAYDRLEADTRSRVAGMLEEELETIEDSRVKELINSYEEDNNETVRRNELHSILPTQIADLSPELEEYYARYFNDRQAVVDKYQQYKSTFADLRQQINTLQDRVDSLQNRIDSLKGRIDAQRSKVERLNARLERLESQGDREAYNELVPEQNAAVNRYNSMVDRYKSLISRHNNTVERLNEIVVLQRDLVNSLDSTYQELE